MYVSSLLPELLHLHHVFVGEQRLLHLERGLVLGGGEQLLDLSLVSAAHDLLLLLNLLL